VVLKIRRKKMLKIDMNQLMHELAGSFVINKIDTKKITYVTKQHTQINVSYTYQAKMSRGGHRFHHVQKLDYFVTVCE